MSGSVDPNFSQLMTDMSNFAATNAKYAQSVSSTQKLWMIPTNASSNGTWDPVLGSAIQNLNAAFGRSALNSSYSNAHTSSGNTVADVIGFHTQLAYMAVMERAFRERHKTVARATIHNGARKIAHGSGVGVHLGSVLQYMTNMFSSVQSTAHDAPAGPEGVE
jgi:hypothetical protein